MGYPYPFFCLLVCFLVALEPEHAHEIPKLRAKVLRFRVEGLGFKV